MKKFYIITVPDKRTDSGMNHRTFETQKALFDYMIRKKLKVRHVSTICNGQAHQYTAYAESRELKKIC